MLLRVGVALMVVLVTGCTASSATPVSTPTLSPSPTAAAITTVTITLPPEPSPIMTTVPVAPATVEDPAETDLGNSDIRELQAARREDSVTLYLAMAEPVPEASAALDESLDFLFVVSGEKADGPRWRLTVEDRESGGYEGALVDVKTGQVADPFPGSVVIDGGRLNITVSLSDLDPSSAFGVCAIAQSSAPEGDVLAVDVVPDQEVDECESGIGPQLEL